MRVAPFFLLLCSAGALAQPSAVATFESIGLYWKPASDPGPGGCAVQYRRQGEQQWRKALPLWFDERERECRGSLVHL